MTLGPAVPTGNEFGPHWTLYFGDPTKTEKMEAGEAETAICPDSPFSACWVKVSPQPDAT